MEKKINKVAVVILNWNGSALMERFLPSVVRCSPKDEADVVVADNGSTDDSLAMLAEKFPTVRIIRFDRNYGFAEGYNQALKQIENPYCVLLNSDVEVTPGWLDAPLRLLENDPSLVAVQPKIIAERQRDTFEYAGACGGFMDKYGYPFCRGRIMGVVEKDNGQYDTVIPVFWVTGAALFIRQKDYRDAGGLDGRFFAHMEEIDLCWRLRARGRMLVCVPQSTVYHVGGATLKKENPHKTFLNFRNNLVMLYKNLPQEELAFVMRARAVLDYVAALSFLLKGQFPNMWAVIRARRAFRLLRPSFADARRENLKKTSLPVIPERTKSSILVQFYLRGKKRFSRL